MCTGPYLDTKKTHLLKFRYTVTLKDDCPQLATVCAMVVLNKKQIDCSIAESLARDGILIYFAKCMFGLAREYQTKKLPKLTFLQKVQSHLMERKSGLLITDIELDRLDTNIDSNETDYRVRYAVPTSDWEQRLYRVVDEEQEDIRQRKLVKQVRWINIED